jgi:hypothetical protein
MFYSTTLLKEDTDAAAGFSVSAFSDPRETLIADSRFDAALSQQRPAGGRRNL